MKPSDPIGNAIYAPLFLRVVIGAYFIIAGIKQLDHLESFVEQVKAFKVLSNAPAQAYGSVLPYLEILAGGLLVVGFWTTLAAGVASALLVSFIAALGLFPFRGAIGSHIFNKDIILLAVTLSLMYSGAGAISLDRFRKGG